MNEPADEGLLQDDDDLDLPRVAGEYLVKSRLKIFLVGSHPMAYRPTYVRIF